MEAPMYKLVFYVPEAQLEEVKAALFACGAGRTSRYDCVSWEVAGEGQFRPLAGSKPFIGVAGSLQKVKEYRVEMACEDQLIARAVETLKQVHPYEEPAYDVWMLETLA